MVRNGASWLLATEIKEGSSRKGGDQFLRIGVLWSAEDLGWRAAFDDFAGVEDGDAMAKCGDGEQVVRDIEDAHAEFAIKLGEQAAGFRTE